MTKTFINYVCEVQNLHDLYDLHDLEDFLDLHILHNIKWNDSECQACANKLLLN